MPRVIKSADVRKAELLDLAYRLFFERGYEKTTVNDIIHEADLSKGAFYHHFESKEALLEALAIRLAKERVAELERLLDDPSMDAVTQLTTLFIGSQKFDMALARQLRAAFAVMFRPENAAMFSRIDQAAKALALPMIVNLLDRGRDQQVFNVPDTEVFADMIWQLRQIFRETMHHALLNAEKGNVEEGARLLEQHLRLYGIAIDRLLKLPDGTIRTVEPNFARAFLSD